MIRYKGYTSEPRYVPGDKVFHGRLDGIRDVIAYEAATAEGVVPAFREAVEDYLDFCRKRGRGPETPRARDAPRRVKIVVEFADGVGQVEAAVKAVKNALSDSKAAVKAMKEISTKGGKVVRLKVVKKTAAKGAKGGGPRRARRPLGSEGAAKAR